MSLKRVVLSDADIFIHLNRIQFFNLIEQLSKFYNWDVRITHQIKDECEDPVTCSLINNMLKKKTIRIIEESSKEVTLVIEELEKRLEAGAEIELFAIAKHYGYNLITHDRKNTNVFHANYGRDYFFVYNLYQLLFLAYKSNIFSIDKIQSALFSYLTNPKSDMYKIIKAHGFKYYCKEIEDNINKIIDPDDQLKFRN